MSEQEQSSESLAAIIIAFRALHLYRDESRNAMIELMRRKKNGDTFDFEKFIAEKLNQLPKSQLNPDVIRLLSSLSQIGRSQ